MCGGGIAAEVSRYYPTSMPIKINKSLRIGPPGLVRRRFRTIAAILTILFCIVAGVGLINAANRTVSLWGVARDLGVGSTIHSSDLVLRQVNLDRSTNIYLAGEFEPVGLYVTRDLRTGELLPATAVAKSNGLAMRRVVTVGVESRHFPPDIKRGDLVDLYVTPRGSDGEILGAPERVIGDVVVDSVEINSNSSHAGVALSLLDVDVPAVVEAAQRGHLDLVGRQ